MSDRIEILVVVLSCAKYSDTWPNILARGVKNLIILCGGADETKLEGNILYLKCSDLSDGLPQKMLYAYDFIVSSDKFKSITHILKADDHDTEFTKEQIDNIAINYKDKLLKYDYIGQGVVRNNGSRTYHYGKVPKDSIWHNKPYVGLFAPFVGGGETYILSRKSLMFLSANKEMYKACVYEDVTVGLILYKYKIQPYTLDYGIKWWRG